LLNLLVYGNRIYIRRYKACGNLAIKKTQSILSYCAILVNILIIKVKDVYSLK